MAGTTEWNAGIIQATAWGTPVVVDDALTGTRIKFMSDALPPGIPEPIKDENVGEPMSGAQYQGNLTIEGTLVQTARYEGMEFITALFMGVDTYAVHPDVAGVAGTHAQMFQNSNTGKFCTLVLDREFGTLWEYQCCKVSQIEISHSDGKLQITPTFLVTRCERAAPLDHRIKDGDANVAPWRTPQDVILFNHLLVALQEVDGADTNLDFDADSGSDIHRVTDLKITANRNITGDHESGSDSPATVGGAVPGAGEIGEPETDGMPEGTVEITFANHSALVDTFVKESQIRQSGSIPKVFKMTAKWHGRAIAGMTVPDSYLFQADFAALTVADAPVNAGGPGSKTPVTITFNIVTPQTLPLGDEWTDFNQIGQKPFRFYYVNTSLASALA